MQIWLRDELRLIRMASRVKYANEVEDTNGIYIIPAFTGLVLLIGTNMLGPIVGLLEVVT